MPDDVCAVQLSKLAARYPPPDMYFYLRARADPCGDGPQ
jgi:hypothetical protein